MHPILEDRSIKLTGRHDLSPEKRCNAVQRRVLEVNCKAF
jgi:hypothetical protein